MKNKLLNIYIHILRTPQAGFLSTDDENSCLQELQVRSGGISGKLKLWRLSRRQGTYVSVKQTRWKFKQHICHVVCRSIWRGTHVYFLLPNVHHLSLPIHAIYGGLWFTELWMMQHFHAKLQ